MLNLTRISGALDIARLGQAVARPGIDTRTWTCLAIVTEVVVDEDAEGVFLGVLLMPDGTQETARLAQPYAGPGFGSHYPVQVDDEVLVFAPNGDPDEGLIALPRLHSPSDPLPAEVISNPEDVLVVHAKAGQTVRLVTEGGGNVVLDVKGEGQVLLADENATDFVALASLVLSRLTTLQQAHDLHVHTSAAPGMPTTPPTTLVGPLQSVAAERTKAK